MGCETADVRVRDLKCSNALVFQGFRRDMEMKKKKLLLRE